MGASLLLFFLLGPIRMNASALLIDSVLGVDQYYFYSHGAHGCARYWRMQVLTTPICGLTGV